MQMLTTIVWPDMRRTVTPALVVFYDNPKDSEVSCSVTIGGGLCIIRMGEVCVHNSIPDTCVCVAQDWKAFLVMYALFNVDQSLAERLVNAGIHPLVLDLVNPDDTSRQNHGR